MKIFNILSFLFGGFLASFIISWYFFKKSVKREIESLQENNNKSFKALIKVFQKMESDETFPMRTYPELQKDKYSKDEVIKICEDKVYKVAEQRNIQLKQFIQDIILENNYDIK